jgi:hypothetical protein
MGHMTNVSIQIHSSMPQYGVYKLSLKTNEWKVLFGGGSKLTFLVHRLNRWVWLLVFGGF